MLFNSYVFLFGFLPPVLVGCWALRAKNLRLLFLTLASWAFYAWWDWRFLPLMLSTTTVDYVAALMIHRCDVPRDGRAPRRDPLRYLRFAGVLLRPLRYLRLGRVLLRPLRYFGF